VLAGIVRRQRPLVQLAEYLQKEKDYHAPPPSSPRIGSKLLSDGVSRDQDLFDSQDASAEYANPGAAMQDDEEQRYRQEEGGMTESQDL
jgi:hypothetical protein